MKTKKLQTIIFSLLILLAIASNSYSTVRNILVSNFVFTPAVISANVGDTIRWTWINGGHTTTCDGSQFTSRPSGALPWDAPITSGNPVFRYVVRVAGTYNYKCEPHEDDGMLGTINVTASSLALNLTALIEGFWNGSTMVSDTVRVYLHNSAAPFTKIDSAKVQLNSAGNGLLSFTHAPAGSYYIVVKHRNSLETWSSTPISFSPGVTTTYNFTTAASQAFGDNLSLKAGKYTIYSGDVNQDGTIDGSDLSSIDNDASNFVSGYVNTDVNGDTIVDGSDALISENNAANFVSVARPFAVRRD